VGGKKIKEGRQILFQYLKEMGYADQVIHAQAQRLKASFDAWPPMATVDNGVQGKETLQLFGQLDASAVNESGEGEATQDASGAFDFLGGAEEDETEETDAPNAAEADFDMPTANATSADGKDAPDDDTSALEESVMQSFGAAGAKLLKKQGRKSKKSTTKPSAKDLFSGSGGGSGDGESAVGLADLFDLGPDTRSNSTAPDEKAQAANESLVRKAWKSTVELRSHVDSVQAVTFHDTEFRLASASDDMTIKLWDLAVPKKGKGAVEPTVTYRGHVSPVLSLAMASGNGLLYSGDACGKIYTWKLPAADAKPGPFDPALAVGSLAAHTDAVWALDCHQNGQLLLSAGSDESARVWNTSGGRTLELAVTATSSAPIGCAEFAKSDAGKFVFGCTSGYAAVCDLKSGAVVQSLGTNHGQGSAVNSIKTHATLSFVATANEDKTINFYDLKSGDLLHSMVAHQAGVGSISFDSSGLYMVSGGHDRSIRIWDVGTRTCVNEITCHRMKRDEAINAVAFHASLPYFVSGGADSTLKVFH
jgi:striatin 1/3/4